MQIFLWILAVLIGTPVAIALILALVPVRYRVTAKTGDDTTVRVNASYLLRLIHFTFLYADKEIATDIRIAGFKLKDKQPAGEEHETIKSSKAKATTKATAKTSAKERKKKTGTPLNTPAPEKKDFKTIIGKIQAVLTHKDLKIIIDLILKFIFKMLKYLCPKRFEIFGIVGLSDPFQTGMLLGSCEAVINALNINRHVRLAGDFNKQTVQLNLLAEGRLSIAGIFAPFLWFITRRPIFNLIIEYIKKVRQNKKSKG